MNPQTTDLISIVVPVYNAEQFLHATIKSVQEQSYENWELLLIDDASRDGSVGIIKYYQEKDARISVIEMTKNRGSAYARNRGVEMAKGRYLVFLDADDLWHKDKLTHQTQFMRSHNSFFSYTEYDFINKDGLTMARHVRVPSEINYRGALKNNIIWTSTVMIDLTVVDKIYIYMPALSYGEDLAAWWLILSTYGPAQGLCDVLAYYRRTSDSLSANKLKAVVKKWFLYRNVAKLSFLPCIYYYLHSLFNATLKRI